MGWMGSGINNYISKTKFLQLRIPISWEITFLVVRLAQKMVLFRIGMLDYGLNIF
jgi:hypothetical protein